MNHVKSQCYVFFVTNNQLLIYVPPYMVMSEAQERYTVLCYSYTYCCLEKRIL